MSFDQFGPACVLQYPYLWARQATAGETEGRKDRPTVVGFRLPRNDGQDLMILFPITSQSPSPERFAVEIPETERRRGGLDVNMRLWIILDEYNEDVVGRSYYLEPSALIGKFSRAFFVPVVRQFIERRARAKGINRRS